MEDDWELGEGISWMLEKEGFLDKLEHQADFAIYLPYQKQAEKLKEEFPEDTGDSSEDRESTGKENGVQMVDFPDEASLQEYVELAKSQEVFETGENVAECHGVLTLVTCAYEWNGARTVVIAVR